MVSLMTPSRPEGPSLQYPTRVVYEGDGEARNGVSKRKTLVQTGKMEKLLRCPMVMGGDKGHC